MTGHMTGHEYHHSTGFTRQAIQVATELAIFSFYPYSVQYRTVLVFETLYRGFTATLFRVLFSEMRHVSPLLVAELDFLDMDLISHLLLVPI